MGTQESQQKNLSDYKNSERIGVYRQFEENGRNKVELSRQLPSQAAFQKWKAGVDMLKTKHLYNQVVYLPERYHFEHSGLCGSSGTLKIIFERWESFLREEVASRRKNQHFYTQEELWFILFTLSKLGPLYQPLAIKIGDIHPNNIIVTGEGYLRVVTRHSLPDQPVNFDKIVQQINSDVFLAPQELDEEMIERGIYESKHPEKGDAFSVGMTMLQVSTLQSCSYLYIRNPLRISLDKFNTYKKFLKNKYSQDYSNMILGLLQMNHRNRLSLKDIHSKLLPYQQSIVDMRQFSFTIQQQTQKRQSYCRQYSIMRGQGSKMLKSSHSGHFRQSKDSLPLKTGYSFKG